VTSWSSGMKRRSEYKAENHSWDGFWAAKRVMPAGRARKIVGVRLPSCALPRRLTGEERRKVIARERVSTVVVSNKG